MFCPENIARLIFTPVDVQVSRGPFGLFSDLNIIDPKG